MKQRKFSRSRILFYVIVILAFFGYRYYQQQQDDAERKAKIESAINQTAAQQRQQENDYHNRSGTQVEGPGSGASSDTSGRIASIADLTDEEVVIKYIQKHQKLPDYYITKKEARKKGWDPSKGDLCDVLPGRAIGGDHFGNFEKKLPHKKGREYREADINYNCGHRNASRLIFSNDGLIYTTDDHYISFTKR